MIKPAGRPRPGPNPEAPSRLPASSLLRRSMPLFTAHHPPFLPPPARLGRSSSASRGTNISPVLSSFRILAVTTGVYYPLRDLCVAFFPSCERPSLPTLLFTKAWRLFVVSLHLFLHSFPLFSIVCNCNLFSENTRVGVPLHFLPSLPQSTCAPPHPQCVLATQRSFAQSVFCEGLLAYPEFRGATSRYRFRHASTASLLRQAPLLATIARTHRIAFSGAARLSPWVETRMATINRQELERLERRELQLTIMAAVFVFILASGLAVFMCPLVFVHPDTANRWTLRVAFFGFCALTLLFIGYLLERQSTVRKLKQQILE